MKKTYTIFGHTGFIGRYLKKKLKKNRLILPNRNQIKLRGNLGNIIYCIGSDLWKKDIYNSFNANLGYIPEILKSNKFKSFNFISSIRIYNGLKKGREKDKLFVDPVNIDNYFNVKKICAESLLLSSGHKIKIIRLCNLYGDNFKAPIFLPTVIRNAVKNKSIDITINKESKKNYLNVNEATDIIIKIINNGKDKIYNVASDKQVSLFQIAKSIKKSTNCRIKFKNQKMKMNEAKIDISKIKKEFLFKPKSNLITELDYLINLYSKNIKKNEKF